jgi:hypothetical protein
VEILADDEIEGYCCRAFEFYDHKQKAGHATISPSCFPVSLQAASEIITSNHSTA